MNVGCGVSEWWAALAPAAPADATSVSGTRNCPPVIERMRPAWFTTWSRQT